MDGINLWAATAILAAPFVGSFLGVLVERLPAAEPVVFARSRCRGCGRRLGPAELLPLVSWLAQRGRCRGCGAPIGGMAPGIELAALAAALWAAAAAPGWLAAASAGLGWSLIALAVIDLRHMILPDELTLPLIPAGLIVAAVSPGAELEAHLVGAALGGALLAGVAATYRRLRDRDGLGWGDVKLFVAAGAWLGWRPLPATILLSAGGALAAALAYRLVRRTGPLSAATEIPFGPFIAGAIWVVWLHGPIGPA